MKSVDALRELVKCDGLVREKDFDKCLDAIEEEGMAIYARAHGDGAALAFELAKIAYKDDDERYQFCRRVEVAANDRNDVTLFGVDYMPCPLDSNGTPIHIGDDVKVVGYDNGNVASIDVRDDGTAYVGVRPYGWDTATVHRSDNIIHTSAPTVEDVLWEFLDNFHDASCIEAEADVVAEYAAKLRLAGEDE